MRVRDVYASVFGIPRANVDVAGFLMKIPFRSVCSMPYYTCFPAYAG